MNLVIVESPAKAKTIEKYLGKEFKVLASYGHVRDLPPKELGIDVGNEFTPDYVIDVKSKKVLSEIKKADKNSEILYLATDLDREGEAISWHILKALKLKNDDPRVKRIVFNEITKSAIEKAVKNPRILDMDLVDAQQARRILDRLFGYKLSPLLWKKVKSGLSAGRVQSVAVRLVADREKEIKAFKPEEFWVLGANLSKKLVSAGAKPDGTEEKVFATFLIEVDGEAIKKLDIKTKAQADTIEKGIKDASYKVLNVDKVESLRKPPAPFTTSTLQMEASRKLGFSAKQTMRLAQGLYEDGHISYMRTDSTNLSGEAITAIRKTIKSEYGDKYLPESEQKYQTKTKRAQEAHEAIRPTHFENQTAGKDPREERLYSLIWKRVVASQMSEARFDVTTVFIEAKAAKKYKFVVKGEILTFDGFIRVYTEGQDEEVEETVNNIPEMVVGDPLDFHSLIKDQKFTEPPKRYTEAMLVKKMESLGIGRPSTYAPTLSTIQDRGYVTLDEKKFFPTEIGMIVNDLLVEHFADVVDYQFTAKMEDDLDEVASGEKKWVPLITEFYDPFIKNIKDKEKSLVKDDIMKPEMLKEKCPECKELLMVRHGRFGKFVACSSYPKCKYSRPLEEKGGEVANDKGKLESVAKAETQKCDKCGGTMILKEGRFGQFLACENYPKCKNTKTIVQSSGIKCPDCEKGEVIQRRTKKGRVFWGCSNYPECKYASWEDPTKERTAKDTDGEKEQETLSVSEKNNGLVSPHKPGAINLT